MRATALRGRKGLVSPKEKNAETKDKNVHLAHFAESNGGKRGN